MTSHGQCPRGGGCLWMSKSGGVFQFFGGRMTSRGQCPRGGGACECPRVGVFFNFLEGGWRHANNVQGGGACECLHPPPPLQEILYPCLVFHPSKFRPPPPPGWLATGLIPMPAQVCLCYPWIMASLNTPLTLNPSTKVWKFVFDRSYLYCYCIISIVFYIIGKPVHFFFQWCTICNNHAFVGWAAQLIIQVGPKWNVTNFLPISSSVFSPVGIGSIVLWCLGNWTVI